MELTLSILSVTTFLLLVIAIAACVEAASNRPRILKLKDKIERYRALSNHWEYQYDIAVRDLEDSRVRHQHTTETLQFVEKDLTAAVNEVNSLMVDQLQLREELSSLRAENQLLRSTVNTQTVAAEKLKQDLDDCNTQLSTLLGQFTGIQ